MEFVVGASEATMRSLLGKLGGLLAQEYTLIRGVRGDIQYISDELASMQAFLGDLGSALDDHDRRLKNWMKQIRDMAYDMEDCIDDFAHRLPQDSLSDARCSFVMTIVYDVWTFWPRRDIASKIAELKVRAQHIAERRSRYGVDNPIPRRSSEVGATHAVTYGIAEHLVANRQLIRTEDPVGVKVDMEKLRVWLTKHDKGSHRAVLSLIGFGGVGKTTIAMALYRDFRNEFDCRASVTVSQNFDEDEVLRDVLGQIKPEDSQIKPNEEGQEGSNTGKLEKKNLVADIKSSVKRVVPLLSGHRLQSNDGSTQSKIETMNRDQLIEELKKRLLGRRYLLLIDDIWSVETWETIRNWLPHDNTKDSRVIVTTRFQAVGAVCSERDGTDYMHTVNVLSDADSQSLFDQGVSESPSGKEAERMDTRSQAVGTKSSEGDGTDHLHSADVPSDADAKGLLNVRVSDPQSSKRREKEEVHEETWKYCGGLPLAIVTMAGLVACNPKKNSDHWSKVCKSLFPEQVAPLTLEGVTRILDYCYNDLPADLKTCSLYLSIFPKGSKISKKRLTRRWISECFVAEKQGLSAEEVAETYFNQLVSRKIMLDNEQLALLRGQRPEHIHVMNSNEQY